MIGILYSVHCYSAGCLNGAAKSLGRVAGKYQTYGDALEFGPRDADGDAIAPGFAQAEPAGQLQQVGQDLLVQLQVGQVALAPQGAEVDFVW